MMRSVYNEPERFYNTYFIQQPGVYFTGDGARKDEDGYFWLMGRVDDVVNVSGHRIGTAEVESALVSHPSVAEAAVVGFPHDIKGEDLYAYVILSRVTREAIIQKRARGPRQKGNRTDRLSRQASVRSRSSEDEIR